MEHMQFPHALFAILCTSLAVMFIHCRYKVCIANQFAQHVLYSTESEIIFLCVSLNTHYIGRRFKQNL